MAKTTLKSIGVYVTEPQHVILSRAAAVKKVTLSNLLLHYGLEGAVSLGVPNLTVDRSGPPISE